MRCPDCQRLMSVAFIDDVRGIPVYRCSTAGVPLFRTKRNGQQTQAGSTLDHSEFFFTQQRGTSGALMRVKPVDLGKNERKSLIPPYGKEEYREWTVRMMTDEELKVEKKSGRSAA